MTRELRKKRHSPWSPATWKLTSVGSEGNNDIRLGSVVRSNAPVKIASKGPQKISSTTA
jgi:hypothetical protein